ncbi:MAG: DegT/DnrJ/EryC1/StrS aminotransferase family protein, partial [Nitrospinota bacterium]
MKCISHSRPSIEEDDIKAVSKVLASGMIAQGKRVEDFEKAIARQCKVKYTVAVSSGSAALHLALLALEIGKKDTVAIPSYSCASLLNVLRYVGATPKFIDIDPETLNISPKDLKKKVTGRVKAVIVPHMFGFPADLFEIKKLGLPIIEDCALALGAKYRGKPVGYWGDISVFSFYATKVIATGEGGMITTRSKSLADYIKDIRE